MASDQVQMFHPSTAEQTDNEENVILRAIAGNPRRHRPLAQHTAPTTTAIQKATPSSMYTLKTRYQPIPSKVIPQPTTAKVYYIESQRAEQTTNSNPVLIHEETPLPAQQEAPQTILLEPQVLLQPVLYSIVGAKHRPIQNNHQPITTITNEMPEPILYSLVANPRYQARIQEPVKQAPEVAQQPSLSLYTVVGGPRVPPPVEESASRITQIPKQSHPVLYSVVAHPKVTSNMTSTNTPDVPPPKQLLKDSSVQPAPILYSVVGEAQVPNNISTNDRPPVEPPKQQPQQKQATAPTLYTLIGKPKSLSKRIVEAQLKPSPPAQRPLAPVQHVSRSLERQSAPEPKNEPDTFVPPLKKKYQARSKEPTIPKSETIFIPLADNERTPRPKPTLGRIHHQQYQIPNYDPLHLSNYISPYTYHPSKSYRERTVHPTKLPIITNNPTLRKPLAEPRHRSGRRHYYDSRVPHSLERYPVRPDGRSRMWDYEYHAGTDVDDDDDMDESNTNRRRQRYRRYRIRSPWIPVW